MIQQSNSLPKEFPCSTHVFYTLVSSSAAPTAASSSTQFILNPKPKKVTMSKSAAKEMERAQLNILVLNICPQLLSEVQYSRFSGLWHTFIPSHPIPAPTFDDDYAASNMSSSLLFSTAALLPHPMETPTLSVVTHATDHLSSALPSPLSPFFSDNVCAVKTDFVDYMDFKDGNMKLQCQITWLHVETRWYLNEIGESPPKPQYGNDPNVLFGPRQMPNQLYRSPTSTLAHCRGPVTGLVLGLSVHILEVQSEDNYSLRGDTLSDALEQDARAGKKPFIFIATVGTTSSGAIDNIREIKEVVKEHPYLRIHVDAAWAGVAFSCPEYRETGYLADINDVADSFCTNFHKCGLVNLESSAFWVKNRKYLTEALDVTPPYMRTKQGDNDRTLDYRNWHLALSRRFRSLKLWFVLRSFGVQGFQQHIRKSIGLNDLFVSLAKQSDIIEILVPPSLGLTVFRVNPPSHHRHNLESLNDLNTAFFGRLSTRNDIYLTQTLLDGVVCIRLAVGAVQTEESHIRNAFGIVVKEATLAIDEWKQRPVQSAL